jgi:hypothetical protein
MKKVNIIWIMVMALCHNFNAYVRAIALRTKLLPTARQQKIEFIKTDPERTFEKAYICLS